MALNINAMTPGSATEAGEAATSLPSSADSEFTGPDFSNGLEGRSRLFAQNANTAVTMVYAVRIISARPSQLFLPA